MDNSIFDRANNLFADAAFGIVNVFMIAFLILCCVFVIARIVSWFVNEVIPIFRKKNDDQHLT